jgi:glycosyltransferase involved in cell wall biosynthesis
MLAGVPPPANLVLELNEEGTPRPSAGGRSTGSGYNSTTRPSSASVTRHVDTVETVRQAVVSVVIPALNVAQTLADQLDALAAQTFTDNFEVVIADNGSTDGTAEVAAAWAARLPVRVVDARGRRGINHARNVGVRESHAPLVLLCDGDDRVSPEWVARMVTALESYDVVGGPLRFVGSPTAVQWRKHPSVEELRLGHGFLPYAFGSNMGFRRTLFDAVGGFDEDYIIGADEIGFSWRAQLRGFSIGLAPGAFVDYRLREGLRATARQFYEYGQGAAHLHRDFRRHGLRRRPVRGIVKSWLPLVAAFPSALRDPIARGRWIRNAAFALGRIRGSLRYHIVGL